MLLRLAVRQIPRDVATRWNSTFALLKFALEYQDAINKFTEDKSNKVRQYELDAEEWQLVGELKKVLQVRASFPCYLERV